MLRIKSTRSGRELAFTKYDGENFSIELKGGISATIRVYGYAPHSHDLSHWFSELGKQIHPWDGELVWESLEGEFKIKAICDFQGHVYFQVSLRPPPGTFEESFISVGLQSELGQLGNIASEARRFFDPSNT
ncbi:DUF6228 family protein [Microbulbifer sp. 2201CG32-9]|uniref:DUF6228 family protein n=1 Tax=Microbulbifer sp. 2201CG32-9 TaxID=3232309 RepID=UPI00345B6B50